MAFAAVVAVIAVVAVMPWVLCHALMHIYDHGFCLAKASFLAELGLVLRSKIAIAPMAKATKLV